MLCVTLTEFENVVNAADGRGKYWCIPADGDLCVSRSVRPVRVVRVHVVPRGGIHTKPVA